MITSSGTISSYDIENDYYSDEDADMVLISPYSIFRFPIDSFFNGKIQDISSFSVANINEENINNILCKKIHVIRNDDLSAYIDIWLSENYSVIKTETINGKNKFTLLLDYSEIDEIFFLKKYTMNVYENNNNDYFLISTTTATFEDDWKLNIPIPPETFQLEFPEGLRVWDRRNR